MTDRRLSQAVIGALVWVPLWLGGGLLIGERWAVYAAVTIALAPLLFFYLWAGRQVALGTSRAERMWLLLVFAVLALLAISISWGPPPEY